MQIQLSWIDPNTEERREPLLTTPVAIGKTFEAMPEEINGERVSRVVIADDLVVDYHILIAWENPRLIVIAQDTNRGVKINGLQRNNGSLKNGDRLVIGTCEILVNLVGTDVCDRMVGFLFKRRCDRTDATDCPYCHESYEEDYAFYPDYGNYQFEEWGINQYSANVNFTEADSVSLERERDGYFEYNMGAS
ncbi:FHA domain-containing protein [Nodularia harveyana UHCC-0300]|uniref:FHA domain-containing protein n=1 Tax=Nodularia harveyana UHCC-0300 TaxID=2974287 RepID=A0ABU5UHI1_9CYAN|nr:FHA domain-containing protein [Nodularia harveyana]MEA5582955.1 FHA domain-containing protein [Nodularia harveyana UHCC-0300]